MKTYTDAAAAEFARAARRPTGGLPSDPSTPSTSASRKPGRRPATRRQGRESEQHVETAETAQWWTRAAVGDGDAWRSQGLPRDEVPSTSGGLDTV